MKKKEFYTWAVITYIVVLIFLIILGTLTYYLP